MNKEMQTLKVGDETYNYVYEEKNKHYIFEIGDDSFNFRPWTWGEKNTITNESIIYDSNTNQFRVNVAVFNELMLKASLVEVSTNGKQSQQVTLSFLRNLEVGLGDKLLQITQWVNGITSTEKKTS